MTTTKPQSTTETLEPCRFCGKESKGHWDGPYVHVSGAPGTLQFYSIVCNGCCSTASYENKERAIAKWNTRLSPTSAAPVVDGPTRRLIGSARHPHFTAADHERMKDTLDTLSDYPTEEEAEAVLQACGTSGKEVVNEFIERLLRENLELKNKLAAAATAAPVGDYSEGFDDAARVARTLNNVAAQDSSTSARSAAEEIGKD